ncbi:ComEC/Rec2 family competence protein [Paenibacillus humicola]|uniref:ComEC/Rec2 family competence protein n=1 Tax=Paenibacillus humicola TaxID=3110540 RepID=UPI00237B3FB5|nr:ComEC/Rec2 family competence protein [Paenibacillus humicola]
MKQRPLVAFAICWVAGSLAAAALTMTGTVFAGVGFALALLAAALGGRIGRPLAFACLAAYGLAAGERAWSDARNATALTDLLAAAEAAGPSAAPSFPAEAEGTIASAVQIDGDRVQFRVTADTVRVRDERAPRRLGGERLLVQVRLAERAELAAAAGWRRGDRVRVAGELERPAGPTNFDGFDYRRYLRSQRIHWLLKAGGASAVSAHAGPRLQAASLLGLIDDARASLGSRMERLFPAEQAGYMKGLVLGIADDLDPDLYRRFSQLGLTHILAISGLHVAVFLYVLGALLKLLRLTRERTLAVMMAGVPLYVLLAGGSPSVVRSGLMAVLGLAAARMNRLKDGLHLLAAAALFMLAWDPYMLENVGFQLSFLVTAGLILGVPPVRRLFPAGGRLKPLYDLVAVSVIAQAVSFPLTVYYFNQFHLLSLPANLILVPFISFIVMPLGGGALLLDALWHPAGRLIALAASAANELTFGLIERLSAIQPLRLIWAAPPVWWIAAMYAAIALTIASLGRFAGRPAAASSNPHQAPDELTVPAEDTTTAPLLSPAAKRRRQHAGAADLRLDARGTGSAGTQPLPAGQEAAFAAAGISGASLNLAHAGADPIGGTQPLRGGQPAAPAAAKAICAPLFPAVHRKSGIHRATAAGAAILLAALLVFAYFPDWASRSASVSFLDVGQGDSILIRSAAGKTILVDGGGAVVFRKPDEQWRERHDPFEVGRKVVVPLLQKRGVHAIDLLVLSHLDSDHIKGALAVVDTIPVRGIMWNGTVKPSDDAVRLLQAAVGKRIPLFKASAGQSWSMDARSRLTVIGGADAIQPAGQEGAVPTVEEQNGQSVALLLELYGRTFLLTGDADAAEERRLLAGLPPQSGMAVSAGPPPQSGAAASAGPPANRGDAAAGASLPRQAAAGSPAGGPPAAGSPAARAASLRPPLLPQPPVDVMKVSHHGSKTSTTAEWLAYWHPQTAVISVGRNNIYGHPNAAVTGRLREAGIRVRRTDTDGEVQFRIAPDGGLYVRTRLAK